MGAEKLIFYIFAALMLASATAVITVRNPVRAVLFLVLTFFASAVLWLLLEAEFLAITLVLVYVGAVMVLFLFVVMMLDINLTRMRSGFIKFLPIGAAVAILMLVMLVMLVGPEHFGLQIRPEPLRHGADYSNVKELGSILYTVYVYPFEIAAVILLVAIVAAIALTLRRRPRTKYQNPDQQVSVRREERVRIVKMASEKRK
jgi:NADH-quinone oxidoreductase subunit J